MVSVAEFITVRFQLSVAAAYVLMIISFSS